MMPQGALAAKVQLLIRKPVEQVFEASVDPATTTRFWFTLVLAGLKAPLEHDLVLNLVADQHPDAQMEGGAQPTAICGTQWSTPR